jgi:hypothetical protein
MMKYLFILLLLIPFTFAHGNVIYNINLDFDSSFKKSIDTSTMKLLNNIPERYDFERELIWAHVEDESVAIHPTEFVQMGYRDNSLIQKGENKVDTKKVAEKMFEDLPEAYKTKLYYTGMKSLYTGVHRYAWFHHQNKIIVLNELFEVEVNPNDGEVIAWKKSLLTDEKRPENPAINHKVASLIAELKFNAEPIKDFEPILAYDKERLIWIVKVKSLYPIFVAIDSSNGEIIYSGAIRGELPNSYSYGKEVEVIPNAFIKGVLN